MKSRHIAVIGSGIAGLSAAWLLAKSHRVTLIEADNRPGGHSNTVDCDIDGKDVAVDTGFIVYNPPAYPNLAALFAHLEVPTAPSGMSFSVSMGNGAYEYAGSNVFQLLGNAGNLFNPGHWRLMRDIPRFFRTALARLPGLPDSMTIGEFMAAEGFSANFIDRHLLPMAGAIWSAPPSAMHGYPARAFLRFFANHGLLKLTNRPLWRTVRGGSREYVSRLMRDGNFETLLRTPVRSVSRHPAGVVIHAAHGGARHFDAVVIATHGDQALKLLADPTPQERLVLGAFRYSRNRAILHHDETLMPKRRRLWASWNYLGQLPPAAGQASAVTYWMNRLQPLPTKTEVFLSLNPARDPAAGKTLGTFDYTHPVFDPAAMAAQKSLWSLQGRQHTWFCGAHFGSGFHEDALQAGLAVAEQLGGRKRPWTVADESGRIHVCLPDPETVRLPEAAA